MSWAKLEKCGSSEANSKLWTVISPPSWRSPVVGVGVLPPPLSSLHAANATTAITAIAASSHNHRSLGGRFIACLLFRLLLATATICSYCPQSARSHTNTTLRLENDISPHKVTRRSQPPVPPSCRVRFAGKP